MKYLLKTSYILLVGMIIVLVSICFQRCEPMRQCHLLKGINILPINGVNGDTLLFHDTLLASDFRLHIHLMDQVFSCKHQPSFSLIQTATATSIYVENIFYDTIKRVTITSDQNFDAQHPAGTSLNDVFEIPTQFDDYFDVVTFIQYSLHSSPDNAGLHQFHVVIDVSNSIPYDTIFPPIYLKP